MTPPGLSSETIAVWLLAAAAFVFPFLAVVAPLGITVELAILGTAVLPFVIRVRAWRHLPVTLLALLVALVSWAAISSLWAEMPQQAATATLRLLGIFLAGLSSLAAGLALAPTALRPVRIALLAGFGLVAAPLLADQLAGQLLTDWTDLPTRLTETHPVKRGIVILALLIWPIRIMMRRRFTVPVQGLAIAAMITLVMFGHSSTAKLATGAGIAVTLALMLAPRRGPGMVGALLVAATLAIPLAASHLPSPRHTFQHWTFLAPSAHHRVTIWGFTAQRIAERPILGWGMDASRGFPGGDQEVVVRRYVEGVRVAELTEPVLPLHPHSAVLQLWLELGAVGAVMFGVFLVWLLSRVARPPAALRGDMAAAAMAAFIMAAGSFGFWQGWWQSSFWLTAVFTLLAMKDGSAAAGLDHTLSPPERNESLRP
ncbi:O-antigen ligase [Magnetospirillum sp. XM-1]|uniref:O-antigen ligase family protein n=1 Tax=Magnetospirillum sp. XM-1 TaxID=1663591 RepID=UPI000A6E70D5|nr:O-antigen ligase family protein [Magnetospirillum sp. XM-1]